MDSYATTSPRQTMQHDLRPQASSPNLKSSFGADIFKIIGGQKRTNRDGQPVKRRGPKPDAKPAMNRRQELNRQAQRTHRERKEQYIRSLETEVSRLREAYGQEISAANVTMQQQKEQLHSMSAENDAMRELLAAHGIPYEAEVERRKADFLARPYQSSPFSNSNSGVSQHPGMASSGSQMYTPTPPTTISNGRSPPNNGQAISPTNDVGRAVPSSLPPNSSSHSHESVGDMDRVGSVSNAPVHAIGGIFEQDPQLQIDFILTLEGPCREHTDYLCRRSVTEADDEDMPFSGHALMATCPPPSYIANTTAQQPYPHKMYDLPHANLTTLLNLSRQLVTEGQITPIMALQCLKSHDMYRNLSREDVRIIIETLNAKVRCYGFGACVEDFELMDCLSSVLGPKADCVAASAAATVGDI